MTLSLKDYQKFTETTDQSPMTPWYYGLGVTGEAGEVAEKVLAIRAYTVEEQDAIAFELGDVLWYVARLARLVCNLCLEEVIALQEPVRAAGPIALALHLNAQAGLIADRIKKSYRRNATGAIDAEIMAKNLATALYFIGRLADECCDLSLVEVAVMNKKKLEDRKARSVLMGAAGDKR